MKTASTIPHIPRNPDDFATQLSNARAYFNNPGLPESSVPPLSDEPSPYADKDGLIEFIIGNELTENQEVMDKIGQLKGYLVAMTSIVTDYINRYAKAYGEHYKTDVALWSEVLSNLPLMGPSKVDTQTYSRHLAGISIAKDFIDFILDLVAAEGSSAMDRCKSFMEKQGEALRTGVEQNKDFYKTITVGVCVEVFKVGNKIVYIPKIKQYRVDFNRENSKFTSVCGSSEVVDIYFSYKYGVNVFDYEALEDPEVKAEFDLFVRDQRKAQIQKSKTFFQADFPVD